MSGTSSDPQPTLRGYASGQRVFGRYVLVRILGHGGMGVVWRARDETLGEDVALKFLPDSIRWDPGAYEDLKAETRRARQLTHPNIIRIHDFVEDASGAAISMELVEGRTLTQLRCEKPGRVLEPADLASWLPQLCAALEYAHTQAKVVHRDLKPSNIMLTREGVAKVGDFGIARSLADSVTRVSMMSAGTLVYMSPQQAMGEEPAPSDDVYALGATLYELLSGKPPFHTGDVRLQLFHRMPESIGARRESLHAAANAEAGAGRNDDAARPPSEPAPPPAAIPPEWEETIAACLAKEPGKRPRVGEIAARLCAPSLKARRRAGLSRTTRALRPARSRAWLIGGAVVAAAGAAWQWWPRVPANPVWPSDATRALLAWNLDADTAEASGRGLAARGVASTVPTTNRYGQIDRALHFNGGSYLHVADSSAMRWAGREPFSISIWSRPDAIGAAGCFLIGNIPTRIGDSFWHLSVHDNGRPAFAAARWQEEGAVYALGDTALPPEEWTHLAGVSDGRRLRLFVNGRLLSERALTRAAIGRRPESAALRVGMSDLYARFAYTGALDDIRLWRRALDEPEIAALAARAAPPQFALTRGNYTDRDDLPAAIVSEFGPKATLADWDEISRWHADDTFVWADELGLPAGESSCLVQKSGARIWEAPRHYYLARFDGTKPAYYLAHGELGGMTLALGSWFGMRSRALAQLPVEPRRERLIGGGDGRVTRAIAIDERPLGLSVSWLAPLRHRGEAVQCDFRVRGRPDLTARCAPMPDESVALAMGDASQPQMVRQLGSSWGDFRFTVVVRDGLLRFRAVGVKTGQPLFQEMMQLPSMRARDIEKLTVSNAGEAELRIE